jgi:anti-anti-sigma factor
MEIRPVQKGKVIILELYGRVDVDSAGLIESVGVCLRKGYLDVLCDFGNVELVDYMGISALAITHKEVANAGGRIKFFNVPAHIQNLFAVTGIDRVIDIFATEESALKSFKEDRNIEKIQKLKLRRRFKRLNIDLKARLNSKHQQDAIPSGVEILSLSGVGAYVYGCGQFQLGEEVILRFNLPRKGGELKLEAKVVWLSDGKNMPHIHPGVGVEFHSISSSDQKKLLKFIERNSPLRTAGE